MNQILALREKRANLWNETGSADCFSAGFPSRCSLRPEAGPCFR